eukprot:1172155-Prymnesium_polylepis.1
MGGGGALRTRGVRTRPEEGGRIVLTMSGFNFGPQLWVNICVCEQTHVPRYSRIVSQCCWFRLSFLSIILTPPENGDVHVSFQGAELGGDGLWPMAYDAPGGGVGRLLYAALEAIIYASRKSHFRQLSRKGR